VVPPRKTLRSSSVVTDLEPGAVQHGCSLDEGPVQAEVEPVGVGEHATAVDDLPALARLEVGEGEVDRGCGEDEVDDPGTVELERKRQQEGRPREFLVRHPLRVRGQAFEIE
jgi:hypothetical protein